MRQRARIWLPLGLAAWLAIAAALAVAAAPPEEGPQLLERRVKGALLYRFLSYVEWPAESQPRPDAPLVIGILGSDALAAELESFAQGHEVEGRPVHVRRLRNGAVAESAHVLFVAQREAARLPEIARYAGPALIVTEWPGALEEGAVINFLVVNGYVRFEISLEAARRRRLEISSRLLAVAHNAGALKP